MMHLVLFVKQIMLTSTPPSASEAFVEVDSLYTVSILKHDGVSQLRLQLRHSHRAVRERWKKMGFVNRR